MTDPIRQVGGDHYQKMAIQPFELTAALELDGISHTIIKYASRWKDKNGIEDLRKGFHTNEFLIDWLMHGPSLTLTPEIYCQANGLGPLETQVVMLICECSKSKDVRLAQEARLALGDLITNERPKGLHNETE